MRKIDEIKDGMSYMPGGTYLYDNGLVILKEGLDTELITANPLIFSQEVRQEMRIKNNLSKYLLKTEENNPKLKVPLSLFRKFLTNGGKVKVEIPKILHIKNALDKERLIIALVYGRALGKNEGDFHFVIVSGYKKGHLYINNPGLTTRQGWFTESDFLYALHSSTCVDVDNGSLLSVGSK